jgi:hypothetical protein
VALDNTSRSSPFYNSTIHTLKSLNPRFQGGEMTSVLLIIFILQVVLHIIGTVGASAINDLV